jgi:hypothetical protein
MTLLSQDEVMIAPGMAATWNKHIDENMSMRT